MNILYVEDNALDADLFTRALTAQAPQTQITIAQTLQSARHCLLGETLYDLVLLDLHLPDGLGMALLPDIKNSDHPMPVIILTGLGDEETAVASLKAGADDYLVKKDDYLQTISQTLEAVLTRFQSNQIRHKSREKNRIRLLYIEHSVTDIDLTQQYLHQYAPHIHMDVITNSDEAITRLTDTVPESLPYDILLTAMQMPQSSGLAVIKTAQIFHPQLPIILVTNYGSEEIAVQAIRLGAVDYLVKHQNYLFKLPVTLENAYNYLKLQQHQMALERSEARFRRLAENAPDIIYRYDLLPQHSFKYISPAVTPITGYTPEEFYADPTIINALAVDDDFDVSIQTPTDQPQGQIRWRHKTGHDIWVDQRTTPVYNKASELIAVEGIVREITQRVLTEQLVRLQGAALHAAANAITITDRNGVIQWVNPAFTKLTGYTEKDALDHTPGELLRSGIHDDVFYQDFWQTILNGQVWEGEFTNRRKDGTLYDEKQTITPLLDDSGEVTHFIAIKTDVTASNLAEQERIKLLAFVEERAQQIALIIRTVPEGVLWIDPNYKVILANPTAEKDLLFLANVGVGDTLEHLGQRPLPDLLQPNDSGTWHEINYEGRSFRMIAKAIPQQEITNGWVVVINDITQQQEQDLYLQAQERLAVVGQLVSGIAHDFNNSLGVILIYAQLLQEMEHLNPDQTRQLVTINNQVYHAMELVNQILDFSRRSFMEMAPLDILLLVKEMIKLLERTLPENILLGLSYDEKEYIVQGDPTRLQQVLMNLVLNARDAMPKGGKITFSLTTRIFSLDQPPPLPDLTLGNWLCLSVQDTGDGIEPQHLQRMFTPFFTTKAPGKGTGLGLAQVNGIVKQHNGVIDVETKVGQGTTLKIYLPQLLNMAVAAKPEEPANTTLQMGSQTILIVEDNLQVGLSIETALTRLGYTVIRVMDGVEAMRQLEQMPIDLMISDLIMPNMDGIELYRHTKSEYPHIKQLIITGYPMGDEFETLQEMDDIHWLKKPFDLIALVNKLQFLLAN